MINSDNRDELSDIGIFPANSPADYNPIKSAVQIAIQHRRLVDAITWQGISEVAAALDNMEGAINKVRSDLGL